MLNLYVVGNRTFKSYNEAKIYCIQSDFDFDLIEAEEIEESKNTNHNGYNLEEINEGIKLLESFGITITSKKFHNPKYYELEKLVYNHLFKINKFIFTSECYEMTTYKRCIQMNDTKKEMDKYLRLSIKYFFNQLHIIKRDCF